jgi:hypothetical protein
MTKSSVNIISDALEAALEDEHVVPEGVGKAKSRRGNMPRQMLSMRRLPLIVITAILVLVSVAPDRSAKAQEGRQVPVLAVDPYWPQLPETWILGVGAGIATDADDHVWIIHRPGMVTEKKVCCKPAPVVMEFDASGKVLQSWSGAGSGYEWPLQNDEHGIFVDHKNNVWIAGRGANGNTENQILKFDHHGRFLLQIGRRGKGTGSNDTANLGQPADMASYPGTNEVFVADGYGNRRVIVFRCRHRRVQAALGRVREQT